MSDEDIGSILVMEGDDLLGLLTERDILNRVVARDKAPGDTKVHEVMTKGIAVISPKITVRDAMQIVTEKRMRHFPVVEDGKLLGILSNGDLTRSIVAEEDEYIDTLFEYIHGSYPG